MFGKANIGSTRLLLITDRRLHAEGEELFVTLLWASENFRITPMAFKTNYTSNHYE